MKIITSKYIIIALAIIAFVLCFFPMQSGRLTNGESYTVIVKGYELMEYSAWGIVILLAPMLVPAILYGCQSRGIKELLLMILMTGNSICFMHGTNAARAWLLEADAEIYGTMHLALLLYPTVFTLLCIAAIVQNKKEERTCGESHFS